ncbi:hypothetical protein EYF80_039537 [Liparis tanakae]|uniref:Uncharacterized protein n=1 Tax=Liparis tanakae TaxID=230148 RepID=A0A4Z2GCA3_9TELE|nr:hypothetical protein EYF80_039537 [Liparis tanakae]
MSLIREIRRHLIGSAIVATVQPDDVTNLCSAVKRFPVSRAPPRVAASSARGILEHLCVMLAAFITRCS